MRVWRPSMTRKIGTTGFRGVTKNGRGFRAELYAHGKRIHLGTFPTALEAAQAWDKAAIEHCGNRSDLNFGVPGEEQNHVEPREVLPDPGIPNDILYKI